MVFHRMAQGLQTAEEFWAWLRPFGPVGPSTPLAFLYSAQVNPVFFSFFLLAFFL